MSDQPGVVDLFIIGGGVNGCGIARDAAGRGLSVTLAEQGDLAQGTSSASTKLFHGGLRYLEFFEFRLVREALEERETLLVAMPHISWPLRFVLPVHAGIRFDTTTPTSRLLNLMFPWMKGRRPAWLLRLGLFLYDSMGGRQILPGTRKLDLTRDKIGRALKPGMGLAWEYSDCWVDDARLVVLNARDAQARGANVLVGTRVTAAARQGDLWRIETEGPAGKAVHLARGLVNAAGPWVGQVLGLIEGPKPAAQVRLVRGSHIVTRRLHDDPRALFLQGSDGRIIFIIPYEQDFSLIGTTEAAHEAAPEAATCSAAERDYLLAFVSQYLTKPVTARDVVWSYAGVRPLYDDGASSATAASRDYVLDLQAGGPVLLNVFGGKITTYRRLAEAALAKLAPHYPGLGPDWTARVPLPGGDFFQTGVKALIERLRVRYAFLGQAGAGRMARAYGTEAFAILGEAKTRADLGRDFGAGLSEAEVIWLMEREWARRAEDVVWRRTKLGLRLSADQIAVLDRFMLERGAR
ncbi:glycerol-3-phosphate dehydrogenase [Rhodobacter capsulatus]|uniref:glycerol-3-phosphate dehydrogenase n=1 Tax=Rhodobacter capsulatus TaxID=1061 RepID=UPI0003D2B6C3|nr:glycerol-3-phosphate dehydrogenase [Rhodobacter capsulatus]ETD80521.1 glycerol-3-phosphate dehydrogenase [Rhodobacter capsulatus B6]